MFFKKITRETKSKNVKATIKNHKDKNGGHPHVILDNVENKHVSVGLTTKPTKGKGSKNYRLEKSPLNDGKQSYMRRQGIVAPFSEYEKQRTGTMTPKDYSNAKKYGNKAKEKYLENRHKKSSEPPTR